MAKTKDNFVPPAPIAPSPAPAKAKNLKELIADAVGAVDDYVYVEVQHDGQNYVAWRSKNKTVHVENRGE